MVSVNVGITWNSSFPVAHRVVERVISDLAPINFVEVPSSIPSAYEEEAFVEALAPMTSVLARPGHFPQRVLRRLPNLRHIAVHGVGSDRIDLKAATKLGIQVTNAPGANAVSVAELTISLAVALLRDLPPMSAGVRDGRWGEVRRMGGELAGRRLGIIGVGQVGSKVATRAAAFDMEVVGCDPAYSAEDLLARGAISLPLGEVVRTADLLTLHVPLDKTTRYLIDRAALESMKPGAVLLNLSRGYVVDESALLEALERGSLVGAALDVREREPPLSEDRLRAHPRVISTPHVGGSTGEALVRTAEICAYDIAAVLRGEAVANSVNRVSPPDPAI